MISVLMTAYNEEQALDALLTEMPDHIDGHRVEITVVDDGSSDDTTRVAHEHGCVVITSPTNRGKGASLQTGLAALRNVDYDALILMDSDGQHDPGELGAMAAPILNDEADLVIGSRYLDSPGRGKAPRNRYAVRSTTVFLVNHILSIGITDPYSGYRAMTRQAAHCMALSGDRYESELEMLFCASRHQMRVVERPIPKIYGPATSKMGARYGAVLGRIDVVTRYALTIARGTIARYLPSARNAKEKISA